MRLMNWSLKVPGRFFGITVRLHLFLLMFWALQLLEFLTIPGLSFSVRVWLFLSAELGLFGIILLHEFGHCFAARSVGGRADEVLLWPLGGLAYVDAPNTPQAQMKTAIGGPAVNVILGLFLGLVLLILGLPFGMEFGFGYRLGAIDGWLCRLFWLNLVLLAFNLLPAFPLDGGRMLQCFLWPKIGFGQATQKALHFGNVCAVGLAVIGLFDQNFILLFIAFFIYIEGQQTKQMLQEGMLFDESTFGYDFSRGYSSLEETSTQDRPRKPGLYERWTAKRKLSRLLKEKEEWDETQKRVDELLEKVSESGLHSLSDSEKRFLREASKRYQR